MKHLFIVNPIAGGRDCTDEVHSQVKRAFSKRNEEYEIYVTKAPLDAVDKIKEEASGGRHIHIYACGGDGTLNECICGAALLDNAAVCPFPIGTGNDFCRMFGNEKDLFRDLEALLSGEEYPIDIIDCNGRYSVNICSVGIDARIGINVHKYSGLPIIGGAAAYVVSAVINILKGINVNMRIRCGDFIADGKHALVSVCNGRYYGGGFNPSIDARPDDGILDIFVVRKVNLIQLAAMIGKYSVGKADELRKFITHLRSDSIDIELDCEDGINVDGEAIYADKVSMKLIPRGVRLIVPKGMRFFLQGLKS